MLLIPVILLWKIILINNINIININNTRHVKISIYFPLFDWFKISHLQYLPGYHPICVSLLFHCALLAADAFDFHQKMTLRSPNCATRVATCTYIYIYTAHIYTHTYNATTTTTFVHCTLTFFSCNDLKWNFLAFAFIRNESKSNRSLPCSPPSSVCLHVTPRSCHR